MDLYDAASYHALVKQTEHKSPKTLESYLRYERRFLTFLEARHLEPVLDSLNAVNVRQAVLWLQRSAHGKRDGHVSVQMFVVVMKVWAGFLYQEGVLPVNPLDRVKEPAIADAERQPYTQAEILAMLHAAQSSRTPLRDRLLVHLFLDTGARVSEVTGITLDRLRLDGPHRRVTVFGKGSRERTIPFGDPTVPDGGDTPRLLRAYLREREHLFDRRPDRRTNRLLLTPQAWALTSHGAEDVIARLGQRAGVADAIPHRFRHTFATVYLTQFPGDESGLRQILGHVSREVMRHYLHLADSTIAQRAGRATPSQYWLRAGPPQTSNDPRLPKPASQQGARGPW